VTAYRCNLVIPGFPKSGTSSFHEYLAQHSDICMSRPKERHHFSRSDRWAEGSGAHNEIFKHAVGGEQYFGESSTTYCIWPAAAERIVANLKRPKIVFLMRQPVERTLSHYRWMYRLGLESRPLRKALLADGDRFHPDHDVLGNYKGYLAFSRYADHLPLWEELVPSQNVLLVSTSKLAASPNDVLARVHEFLRLPPQALVKTQQINRTRDQWPLEHRPWASVVRAALPGSLAGTLRRVPGLGTLWSRAARRSVREPPPTTDGDREWLYKILESHVRFFEERT